MTDPIHPAIRPAAARDRSLARLAIPVPPPRPPRLHRRALTLPPLAQGPRRRPRPGLWARLPEGARAWLALALLGLILLAAFTAEALLFGEVAR